MIDIDSFQSFLIGTFSPFVITIDNFKEDVKFIDIDCFLNKPYKLTIALSTDDIRFATLNKNPDIDFSLYDYVFTNVEDAKIFALKIAETRNFPFRPK